MPVAENSTSAGGSGADSAAPSLYSIAITSDPSTPSRMTATDAQRNPSHASGPLAAPRGAAWFASIAAAAAVASVTTMASR